MSRFLTSIRVWWEAPPPWLFRLQLAVFYLKRPRSALRFLFLLRDYKPYRSTIAL